MARTSTEIKGAGGISAFIVERGTPDVSLGKPGHKMGHKGAHTCDVIFENARVPTRQLIGGVEGVGFKTAMKLLDKGRDPEGIKLGEIRQGIYFEGEWEAGAIEGDVFNYNGEAAGTLDGLTLTRNDPPGKLTQCQLVRKA